MPPAIPDKIPCETEHQLEREIETLRIALDQEETEESWEPQLRALARFKSLVRGGAYKHDSFVQHLKPLCRFISSPMLSERGRLSAVAIELISTLASALGRRFDPLMQGIAPTLMRLCQRPNKVVISRTQTCITTVIKQTRLPSILPFLREAVKDKSATLRTVASDAAYVCITHIEVERIGNKVTDFEAIIKTTGRDANPEVRKQARAILQEYREKFPERYAMFISPLTPVTRKYLEVNKAPVDAPQPLKLAGPAFKQAPQSTTNMTFPERPPSSASIRTMKANQGFPVDTLPPRPHSVASVRPKAAPFARSPPLLVSNKPMVNPRPLSVNLLSQPPGTHNNAERPRSLFFEPSHQVDARPVVVSLSASPSATEVQKLPEARFDVDMDPRQRQRSISVSRGREDADRALRLLNGAHSSKPRVQVDTGNGDPQPRPVSTAPGSSSSSVMRSKSAMSMLRYDEALHRNPRPISIASNMLEQSKSQEDTRVDTISTSRPISLHLDEGSRPTVPIPLPTRTPRAAFERPQVVYLQASEVEQPSANAGGRPRPQKTWSLSHQLELLNKRKKAEEAKVLGPKEGIGEAMESEPVSADLNAVVFAQVDTPIEEFGTRMDQPVVAPAAKTEASEEIVAQPTVQNGELQEDAKGDEVTIVFPTTESKSSTPHKVIPAQSPVIAKVAPILLPTPDGEDTKPAASGTLLRSDAFVGFPAPEAPNVVAEAAPTASSKVEKSVTNNASSGHGATVAPTSNKPSTQLTSKNKGPHQPPVRTRTISAASKQSAPPAHARVASTSKDTMQMPVRVPSRNASQASGFVPKRTVKNSITQPTKSQTARAQAVMDEKTATAATRSDKASQLLTSAARKPGGMGLNGRDQQHVSKPKATEASMQGQMSIPSSTTEVKPRIRDGPRKPAVPTVSSLVKTHAAQRKAGLAQVAIRLGAPSLTNNGSAKFETGISKMKPKSSAVRAAPMKKVALSLQERQPFKPRSNTGQVPMSSSTTSSASPKQNITDVLLAYEGENKAPIFAAGDTGLISPDSSVEMQKQPEVNLVAERSDATIPLPSASFSLGDEMIGITFKRVAAVPPIKGGNEGSGGAGLFKELQVS